MASPIAPVRAKRNFNKGNAYDAGRRVAEQINAIQRFTATIDFSSLAADTSVATSVAVAAASAIKLNDVFLAIPPANWLTGVVVELCYADADNSIRLRVRNVTAAGIDQPSGVWTFVKMGNTTIEFI
jgi:hypothetical protein